MDPERWQKVKALFASAVERAPDERPGFLARLRDQDPGLADEVRSLLDADRDDGFLEDFAAPQMVLDSAPALGEGDRVGRYRLMREIGHGGMGTVFLAERADGQFEQRVAVKLVRLGLESEAVKRRFHRERQILARLEHPHIARLLDGGSTPQGASYLVMEHVEGVPIDRYCDQQGLEVRARVELAATVCAAVRAAHRRLVVHRDLKPANILVTRDGSPKLLDFGIATLLDRSRPDTIAEEAAGQVRPMTPEYASPEQLRGEPATVESDVYSLGVLLYQLLTGRLPYRFERRDPESVVRVVVTAEPERPSTAVEREAAPSPQRQTAADPPSEARPAGTATPERLRRQLRGDLDAILLRCLARDPADRYPSVEQLEKDLRLYLAHRPVAARPPRPAYRLSRFLRRHRFGVAAATAVGVLLVALAAQSVRYGLGLQRERDRARAAQLLAERREGEARELTGFLVDLFEVSDPASTGGETITAREILSAGAERLGAELTDQPAARARLLHVVGRIQSRLGLREEAAEQLEQALALRLDDPDADPLELAETFGDLGDLRRAQKRFERAEDHYRAALERFEGRLGRGDPRAASLQGALASTLIFFAGDQQRLKEADRLSREALESLSEALGGDDELLLGARHNRAMVLRALGDLEGATDVSRDLLAQRRRVLGPDHPHVASNLNNLAFLYRRQERWTEAEASYREALALNQRVLGSDHPDTVQVMTNLAAVLASQDRNGEAELLLQEVVEINRRTHPRHWRLGSALIKGPANLMLEQELYRRAEAPLREGLAIYIEALGDDHSWTGAARGYLAACLYGQGREQEAAELAEASFALLQQQDPLSEPNRVAVQQIVGHLRRAGERAVAERFRSLLAKGGSPPP